MTAQQFAAKLDFQFSEAIGRLKRGEFGFSKLRAVFIPKDNSDKERMICIPTVRDRLIQRVILEYVVAKKFFPVEPASSFGFVKGQGTRKAIKVAVELRGSHDWCLKTDIESFFDKVPREYLKGRVKTYLGRHSLTPLIFKAINCEVKVTPKNSEKISKQQIKTGIGIRQGMPLSPLLANLALVEFDRAILRRNIKMVRYADDLVLFFKTKKEAKEGEALVRGLLAKIELTIPAISENSKTQILSNSESLHFLGREIKFLGLENKFVAVVANKQISKIKQRLSEDFSFKSRLEDKKNFQETIVDLAKSISAYLGIYSDAHNFKQFEDDLRGHGRAIIKKIFEELFGQDILRSLNTEGRGFLGMDTLDQMEPNTELDV